MFVFLSLAFLYFCQMDISVSVIDHLTRTVFDGFVPGWSGPGTNRETSSGGWKSKRGETLS